MNAGKQKGKKGKPGKNILPFLFFLPFLLPSISNSTPNVILARRIMASCSHRSA
jgi:hypothetical protein